MTTTQTTINLWLDKTSEPGEANWIISRDDEKGSVTLRIYGLDDYDDAVKEAKTIAKSEGLEITIENDVPSAAAAMRLIDELRE